MEKDEVNEKKEIANSNDTNKFEGVEIYQEVVPIKKEKRTDSYFDGGLIELIGINILCKILNFISFGLLSAFTVCFKLNWINKHTIINRKRLVFDGKAISLFGKYILWVFLTAITKQSDGSYSFYISGGEIIIYPVGVKSSQGNSGKVTIDVLENGGALCFQSV